MNGSNKVVLQARTTRDVYDITLKKIMRSIVVKLTSISAIFKFYSVSQASTFALIDQGLRTTRIIGHTPVGSLKESKKLLIIIEPWDNGAETRLDMPRLQIHSYVLHEGDDAYMEQEIICNLTKGYEAGTI